MRYSVPVNFTIMQCTTKQQTRTLPGKIHVVRGMVCDVLLLDLIWGYASSTLLLHTKKWWKKTAPQLCVWYQVQETTEMIRKYAIYEVSQNKSSDTRCGYEIYKTRGTRYLPGTNLIRDSGSKIQDPETIQQCINPTFRLLILSTMSYLVWRYYIFHTVMADHISYIKCHTTTTGHDLRTSTTGPEKIYDAVDDCVLTSLYLI